MFNFIKTLSVRSKMFLSYLLIFIVPLSIIGVSSLYWMTENIKTNTEESYQSLMLNVEKAIDEQFKQLDELSIQLSETSWIKTIMFMRGTLIDYDRIDPTSFKDYIQQLQLYKIGNDFIDDIAIYFHDKDVVISSIGKNNFRWFIEDNFNVIDLDIDAWTSMIREYNHTNVRSQVKIDTYGRRRNGLLCIQSLPVSENTNIKATCIYFIGAEKLYRMLDPLFIAGGTSAIILDENENIVLARNISDELLISILNKSFEAEHGVKSEEVKFENDISYVFYNRSTYNDWTYIISTPKSVIMKGVESIKLIFILLVIISSVVGILGSYALASRNYRPLLNIIELIRNNAGNANSFYYDNEYLWLENSIHSILREEELLNKRLEEQKPIVVNSYLKKLLDEDFEVDNEFLKLLQFLDIHLPYKNLVCGVVTGACATKTCIDKLISSVLNCCKSKIYLVDDDVYTIIFNYHSEKELYYLINTLKEELSCSVENIAVGIGRPYNHIQHISKSYREASTAVRYRLIKDSTNIILFDEIKQVNHCYYLPIDEELQFANFIKAGDYDSAMELFREMLNKNLEQEFLSVNSIQFFFINIQFTMLKIVEQLGFDTVIKIDPNTVLNYNKVDDMKIDIEEICSHICDVVNKNKKSNNIGLKEDIRNYIHKYYTDEQLSLSSVADEFDISPSYLSRFFKEQFGCNFLDYITKMRIDAAKEKLLLCDMEIQIISREVGYNNDGTFRRLFKKHEGISPSEYRNGLLSR